MDNMQPIVSVLMITYNHENYIAQAIDSVLMQKTNFAYELVIGEDCSTDRTREIVLKYKAKYPDKIKLLLQEKNVGMMQNFIDTLNACTGKYIALLEGDDYWTDLYKLQKQVDFLEANPEYVLSATSYKIYDEAKEQYYDDWGAKLFNDTANGIDISLDNFFDPWLTKTLTVVFLRAAFTLNLEIVHKYKYFRDVHLFFHILLQGKGFAHNILGGVYRLNKNGVWGKQSNMHKTKMRMLVYEELYLNHKNIMVLKNKYLDSLTFYSILLVNKKKYKVLIECIRKYYLVSKSINKTIYLLIKLFYHRIKCLTH